MNLAKENGQTASVLADDSMKKRGQWESIVRRFYRNKLAVVGLVILTILLLLAVFADVLFDYDAQAVGQNMQERFLKPSSEHIFGTDQYGRDIFVRVVFGTRVSLIVAFSVAGFALVVGTIIGAIAGFYGGRLDNLLMRLMDVLLAIPSMLLAIVIVASLGTSLANLILANGIARVPRFARIVRSQVLSLRDKEFIEAARASGIDNHTIITKHILPNCFGPIIVEATLQMALSILSVASLSFVGLGIQPPTPEWGSMLSTGKVFMRQHPHLIYFPGFAIMVAVLAFNLIGDGLRDALDPRLKN